MAVYTIPLTPEPQRFGIVLAGREYHLTVRWCATAQAPEAGLAGGWLLDIEEPDRLAPLLMGLPLVTGGDLLAPYGYLGIGGGLRVDGKVPPALDDLGNGVELLFETPEDVCFNPQSAPSAD